MHHPTSNSIKMSTVLTGLTNFMIIQNKHLTNHLTNLFKHLLILVLGVEVLDIQKTNVQPQTNFVVIVPNQVILLKFVTAAESNHSLQMQETFMSNLFMKTFQQ